ncbi:ribonuclease H-like domain-containing protein [Tanacetum coccineum]
MLSHLSTYTGNFMPPKSDLVYPSLDDFVDVNESVSESVVEKTTVETNEPETAKKENRAPIIKDWVSNSDEENVPKGNPQQDLKDKGVIDSGCSRHMTGNKSYLTVYKEINGGFVAFGGNSKGRKITGKVPRKDNMYNVDLKNVIPQGGITCLFVKATSDESNLWHRRLGHVNFKTMNKLVRGNLVRGLPSKLFEINQACVACQMGKQHKALCDNGTEFKNRVMNQFCEIKGIKREFSVARTPQQNRVAERKNRTLIEAAKLIQNCQQLSRLKKPALSFMRPFGCPVTILNTIDHLGKFDGKPDEGFFVGYFTNSKAFRVFNSRTKIVEENLHVQFSENTPNIAGSGLNWLFDIDALTNSMNYKPVVARISV